MWSAARGLVIGGSLAFLAAVLTAAVPALRRAISRLAAIANAAPWVAVAPCLLVILGRDRGPTAVAALAVFFFVFTASSVGLAAAPPAANDVLAALGARRSLRVRAVQLPACWPSVMDGLKLAAPAALAGAIFGEWYGAERGLGVLLIGAMQSGRAERLWAASLISAACGLLAFALFAGLRRLLVGRFGGSILRSDEPVRRRRRTSALIELLTAVGLGAVMVTAWWVWIELADISPLVVPRPGRVWDDLTSAPGDYLAAAGATLLTAAIALCLGVVFGAAAATIASRSRMLAGGVVPIIVVLAATPLVALLPLFARIFGYEPTTVRYLAAAMVFFPVFVYTRSGLAATAAPVVDALDAMGASPNRRFRLADRAGSDAPPGQWRPRRRRLGRHRRRGRREPHRLRRPGRRVLPRLPPARAAPRLRGGDRHRRRVRPRVRRRRSAGTGRSFAVELTLADPIHHLKRTTESETP